MQIKEQQRINRSLPLIETTMQDIRYGLRTLRKHPAYSAVAIATLAIGIGAGTAVFSVAGAVLLRPLPYADPDRLVRIFETNPLKNWTRNIASPANFADWQAQNDVFTDVAAYEQFNSNGSGASDVFLTGQGEPQALKSLGVTGNLFRTLGSAPLMGRTFTDEETFEGKARVVILSYGTWQSVFAGDRGIVGRAVTLSGRTCDVVGVMPRDFFFPGPRRADLAARGVSAVHLHQIAAPALAGPRRSSATRRVHRTGSGRYGYDRPRSRATVPRYEHSDGRAPRNAARQPGLRTAPGAADVERRGRRPLSDRLRQPGEPSARPCVGPRARADDPPRARGRAAAAGTAAPDRVARPR